MRNFTSTGFYRLLPVIALLFNFSFNVNGQVYTKIFSGEQDMRGHIPWYFEEKPTENVLPTPNVSAALDLDALSVKLIDRIAVEVNAQLSKKNGLLYEFGNYSVWKLPIKIVGAKSLSFVFEDLVLPLNASMVIYNSEKTVLHGPVRGENLRNGEYISEIIYGESATIEILLPEESVKEFEVSIKSVAFGFRGNDIENGKAYGQALPCIPDVACPDASNWQDEANSTCLVLKNVTSEHCSGTLLTDDCQSDTPLVQTAGHCIDGENLSSFRFRFNYRNVLCNGSTAPSSQTWITLSGASLRALFEGADASLLEINEPIPADSDILFAGWDRRANIPTELTITHHPQGDVMKFSHDDSAPTVNSSDIFLGSFGVGYTLTAGDAFVAEFSPGSNGDIGTIETGSSGGGYFDQNRRVVAVHSASESFVGGVTCEVDPEALAGRFSSAWLGAGTSSTGYSDWLGATTAPNTTDSHYGAFVSGEEVVCSNDQYLLENFPIGSSLSWAVTPSSLFTGSTTGTGSLATLSAANLNFSGSAVLTFTIINGACSSRTVSKNLWVGKPQIPSISGPSCFEPGLNYYLTANSQGADSYSWNFPTCPYFPFDPELCWENYSGNSKTACVHAGEQDGTISVFVSNRCGTRSVNMAIDLCNQGGGGGGGVQQRRRVELGNVASLVNDIAIYPNPLSYENGKTLFVQGGDKTLVGALVKIYDSSGRMILQEKNFQLPISIDLQTLDSGVYMISVYSSDINSVRKIIVK